MKIKSGLINRGQNERLRDVQGKGPLPPGPYCTLHLPGRRLRRRKVGQVVLAFSPAFNAVYFMGASRLQPATQGLHDRENHSAEEEHDFRARSACLYSPERKLWDCRNLPIIQSPFGGDTPCGNAAPEGGSEFLFGHLPRASALGYKLCLPDHQLALNPQRAIRIDVLNKNIVLAVPVVLPRQRGQA